MARNTVAYELKDACGHIQEQAVPTGPESGYGRGRWASRTLSSMPVQSGCDGPCFCTNGVAPY